MSSLEKNINLDNEIQKCAITKPYEALQSDFAKKLLDHLASKSKFKEIYIRKLIEKIDDETESLSLKEGKDFLDFIDEHREFFDSIMKRYKGKFGVWLQCEPDPESMNLEYEDHILYKNGKYESLSRIDNYIKSRIEGEGDMEAYEGISWVLRNDIEEVAKEENYFHDNGKKFYLSEGYLKELLKINYSERVNKNGVTIHNLNGVLFTAMYNKDIPVRSFNAIQLNNDPKDFSKGISFENLKKDGKYLEVLKKADAKAFTSLEESNKFHFKLMQIIADHFLYDVKIDEDFLSDPKNNGISKVICGSLYTLTRKLFFIPYKYTKEGYIFSIDGSDEYMPGIWRGDEIEEEARISLFLEVDPSLGKQQK